MRRLLNKIRKNSRSQEDGIFFEKITKILDFQPKELKYYRNPRLISYLCPRTTLLSQTAIDEVTPN